MRKNKKTIQILDQLCVRCGKCVHVCPAFVFGQISKGAVLEVHHVDSCIECGHCVDVCPNDSIEHSFFSKEKLHSIDYEQLPSPDQVMLLLKSRRSNRALTDKKVPQGQLDRIVEAALCAPTASNSRGVRCKVLSDTDELNRIADWTVQTLVSSARLLNQPILKFILKPFMKDLYASVPSLLRLGKGHENGDDPVLRKATTLVVFYTSSKSRFGCEDSQLAYQNGSLMAQSMGISQIYMGFVMAALKLKGKSAIKSLFGIEGTVHAIMALGVPAFRYAKYADRD